MTGWRNWAGDQTCIPAVTENPASTAEVIAALERAGAADRVVRVAGAGHSFTDGVLTDGSLLSLDRMDRVLDADRSSGLVRVQAGIRLHALSPELWAHGLALENLGDVDSQSVAGATATATHGTGARLRNLSAALQSIELVTADGTVVELNEGSDPEAWRAARVSLGALGVITEVTLQALPAFALEGVDDAEPLGEVLDSLHERAAANEHFEFFTFPHSPLALTRTNNRVEAEPQPPRATRAWFDEVLMGNHALHAICVAGRVRPSLIPALNRALSKASGTRRRVDRSYAIFTSPRRVRFTEMEYAVPSARAVEAVRAVKAIAEEARFDVSFPIEVRLVAGDDALISPAAGRDTCYIAVHMFRGMEWEPYFRAVEDAMNAFDGRPHWGKRHFQTAATLRDRYPEWDRFAAVRERLDPGGRFANAHVRRVLGAQ